MSNKNSFNTMTIVMTIVGLIVGAGGGYFIANNSVQSEISSLNDEIFGLRARIDLLLDAVAVIDDYAQYEIFGFSFEYPETMMTSLSGLLESEATDDSGMIQFSDALETNVYTVTWVSSLEEPDTGGSLDAGYYEISDLVTERGERKTFVHSGHTVYYEEYLIYDALSDAKLTNSGFYCPEVNRAFNINFISYTHEPTPILFQFYELFSCH